MAVRGPRWLRSARHRPAAALAVLLLSAGAVLVSATTPMLIGAVAASTLREGVAAAELPASGISVSSITTADSVGLAQNASDNVLSAATDRSDLWGPHREVLESQYTPVVKAASGAFRAAPRFSVALGGCDGLRITGACPGSAVEALLPRALAEESGWGIGTVLVVPVAGAVGSVRIDVVGLYDETVGRGRWLADPTILQVATVPRAVPDVVLGDGSLNLLPAAWTFVASAVVDRPVVQADVAELRAGVAAARKASLDVDAAQVGSSIRTGLPALLDSIARQQAAAAQLAAPIGLQAVALAWFALGAVTQRTARARAAEWGIGRMRGVRPRAWFASVFVEPVLAVVVGAAVGWPLAILVARGAAGAVLGRADGVAPVAPPVLLAVGLAVAGSLVVLAAASLRAARLPLQELLGDTAEPRRLTRAALVGQVALVSLAAAVLWAALTTTDAGGPQLGLLLPVLLAIVIGLAAVRLAIVAVRRASARPPRSLVSLVVGRGLARAPSALVAAQLVLVGAALGAYALQVGAASAAVQTDRAQLVVGAPRVLTVQVPSGVDLLQAVRRADPSGRVALAAADLGDADAQGATRVVAVDTARLDAVSTWRREWQGGADLARLRSTGRDLVLSGTRMTLSVADLRAGDPLGLPGEPGVQVQAVLQSADGWQRVDLGTLRDGVLRAPIPCSRGCRVVMLALAVSSEGESLPWGARFTIESMSTDRQPAVDLRRWIAGDRWRNRLIDAGDSRRPASARVGDAPDGGLAVSALDRSGTAEVRIEPAVGPAVVPAVVGAGTALGAFPGVPGAVSGASLSQSDLLLHPIARAAALPRSLRLGVLVDLATVQRGADPAVSVAQPEVWLAAGEHPAVLAALRRDGVRIVGTETAASAVDAGLRSATNRALLLAGTTALLGVLFGLLALVATRVVDMPERRREWRALRLAGVGEPALRRLALIQLAVPAAAGALLGAVAGSLAATISVGRLPLLVEQTPGPPLDATPPVVALVVLVTVVVLLVVLVSLAVSRLEMRRVR